MTRLVTFGDSWPAGAELAKHEKPFGRLVAESLGMDFFNAAQGATSNDHMIMALQRCIETQTISKEDTAIFFITSAARACVFDDNGNALSIYPWAMPDKGVLPEVFFKYFYNIYWEKFRLHLTMLSLQRICQVFDIDDRYIVGWYRCDFNFPGIDKNKIYDHGRTTCADLFGVDGKDEFIHARDNHYVKPNAHHPNQLGHELIAKELVEWITSK